MKTRLHREARKHVTLKVVIGQGRAHGRAGWVTQTMVAHGMNIKPGSYVLGLLNELHKNGKLSRKSETLANGGTRYCFRISPHPQDKDWIPF